MDYFQMKQETKHESELDPDSEADQYPYAKMPKLDLHHPSASALPLFVPEPKINTNYLSPFPDASATATATALPRTGTGRGSYLSLGQWQELELQALIYRYMLAGAAVPPELLHPIQKSLLLSHSSAPPYFLHHHFQPSLLQSGYWGRAGMDPEPGRCRRTDGKKWRCSREVVGGHKYCERHMHRGRNRSRKPVEGGAAIPITPDANHFSLSAPSHSSHLLNLTQSQSQSSAHSNHEEVPGSDRSDGHVLRHFFDDWPRSTDASGTTLSISMPANAPSDVSLKLSTGVGDENGQQQQQQQQVNWGSGWPSIHVSSMGGPLAEALRSSTSTSSPTSVLHQLPPNSVSGTMSVLKHY